MNEKEAWLEIEEAYDTPYNKRSNMQRAITNFGICNALCVVDISPQLCRIMDNKVIDDLAGRLYFCRCRNEEGNKFRAEYCRKQASLLGDNDA